MTSVPPGEIESRLEARGLTRDLNTCIPVGVSAPRPTRLVLLHHGPDLHVYAAHGPDAVAEDAHLWPGLGPPRLEEIVATPEERRPCITARQVLEQLAWPVGASAPLLYARLLHRDGRNSGLWVQEVARPGWWRVRVVDRVQPPAIEWGLWAVRRRLEEDRRR